MEPRRAHLHHDIAPFVAAGDAVGLRSPVCGIAPEGASSPDNPLFKGLVGTTKRKVIFQSRVDHALCGPSADTVFAARRTLKLQRKISSMKRRNVLAAAGVVLAWRSAEAFPDQTIRIVVPFTPAGGPDMIARFLAEHLSARLAQAVVVENMPGASGNIGSNVVAKAKPDGHTLMLSVNTLVMNASLFQGLPYSPVDDFRAITLAAWGTLALVAHPQQDVHTVQDFVSLARRAATPLPYASPGVGTPHHLAMELLQSEMGIELLHVPYKGAAGATQDLLAGQIGFMFLPVHVAGSYVKSGRLNALAVGSARRSDVLPEVPTLIEQGVTGANIDMWYGLFAPKGTDDQIVGRLNAESVAILQSEEARSAFGKQGLVAAHSTPAEFAELVAQDYERWRKLIGKRGISVDMASQAGR
jgi:tripartite-type tricarboxylate transporter receptor subunit TctC